jgi:hypothetical protein
MKLFFFKKKKKIFFSYKFLFTFFKKLIKKSKYFEKNKIRKDNHKKNLEIEYFEKILLKILF